MKVRVSEWMVVDGQVPQPWPGRCTLDLVASYERSAFDLPDVCADRHVVSAARLVRPDGTEPDHLVDLRPITS